MNNYVISVCFSNKIIMPYNIENISILSIDKILRVDKNTFKNLYKYNCYINTNDKYILITDTINSIVLKLNKDKTINKRSPLLYEEDINICKIATKLKETKLEYKLINQSSM